MKEKIKALMQQAGTDTSGKWMGVEHAEKLVELVVKECALQCNHNDDMDRILAHFDIE